MRFQGLAFGILLFTSLVVSADDGVVGSVKTLSGTVTIATGASTVEARTGSQVFQGSRIQTGAHSSVGITFKDDTLMALGADTELWVDEYWYAPSRGLLKLSSSLVRGTLNYLSGVIAKLQPEAVSVKTPSGFIGVRGTQMAIKVEKSQP